MKILIHFLVICLSVCICRGQNETTSISITTIHSYTVLDVTSFGARIRVGSDAYRGEEYFVHGLTGVYSDGYYGSAIFAVQTNAYVYTTVQGATRKIPALHALSEKEYSAMCMEDHCIKLTKASIRAEELRNAQEAKIREQNEKAFAAYKRGATNDSVGSQFELGKMYVNGTYPAEKNRELGLYWIRMAETNGSTAAKSYLEKHKND